MISLVVVWSATSAWLQQLDRIVTLSLIRQSVFRWSAKSMFASMGFPARSVAIAFTIEVF
jgi:hypothetical protein